MENFTEAQKKEIAEFVVSEFAYRNAQNVRFAENGTVWATVDVERGTVDHAIGTAEQLWRELYLIKALRWEAKQERMKNELLEALDSSYWGD